MQVSEWRKVAARRGLSMTNVSSTWLRRTRGDHVAKPPDSACTGQTCFHGRRSPVAATISLHGEGAGAGCGYRHRKDEWLTPVGGPRALARSRHQDSRGRGRRTDRAVHC